MEEIMEARESGWFIRSAERKKKNPANQEFCIHQKYYTKNWGKN